jgi:hypothetical protein
VGLLGGFSVLGLDLPGHADPLGSIGTLEQTVGHAFSVTLCIIV